MDLNAPCFDASTILSGHVPHIHVHWNCGQEANNTFIDTNYGEQTLLVSWVFFLGIVDVDGIGSLLPSFSDSEQGAIEVDSKASRYRSKAATFEVIFEVLTGEKKKIQQNIRPMTPSMPNCHKFSTKALVKREHRALFASVPEFSEWPDRNKEMAFCDISRVRWFTPVAELCRIGGKQVSGVVDNAEAVDSVQSANLDRTIAEGSSSTIQDQTSTASRNKVLVAENTHGKAA